MPAVVEAATDAAVGRWRRPRLKWRDWSSGHLKAGEHLLVDPAGLLQHGDGRGIGVGSVDQLTISSTGDTLEPVT